MVTVRAIYEEGKLRLLDKIDLDEGQEIEIIIEMDNIPEQPEPKKKRIFGLHRGSMQMSDDFDDPLPDSFWLGEDE